jgi:hypothetical protein
MIGDSDIDIAAGRNAGCRTARLLTDDNLPKETADLTANTLPEAIGQILSLVSDIHTAPSQHQEAPALARFRTQ